MAGKARIEHGLVQQDAGMVAGERPPGAIRTMHAGGKTDNQQVGACHAKGWHRLREIRRLLGAHFLQEGEKARTGAAFDVEGIGAYALSLRTTGGLHATGHGHHFSKNDINIIFVNYSFIQKD
jgi:hypothetical protein